MIELSNETKIRIRKIFRKREWDSVEDILLNRCGDNLGGIMSSYHELAERVRFAVLKLSNGNLAQLERQIEEAAVDFRDILVAAGFAERVDAHLEWLPTENDGT